jgi:hypothetical protein
MQDFDEQLALRAAMQERIAELEARLERVESRRSVSRRSRGLLNRVMPDDASRHFRAATREQLLGMRSVVDFWIRRLDAGEQEPEPAAPDREEIPID